MENKSTAERVEKLLENIATLLEIKGEDHFRINAYRNAAENISLSGLDIKKLAEEDRLDEISGIGEAISEKIKEYVTTGRLKYYEDLINEVPESLLDLTGVPGLGPKRVKALWKELDIKDIQSLASAVEEGSIQKLEGFGPKLQEKIRENLRKRPDKEVPKRQLLHHAWSIADLIIDRLGKNNAVKKISAAGSLRRMKETIGDVDILVASEEPEKVTEDFLSLEEMDQIIMKGSTRTSIMFYNGIQADLRIVPPGSWGTALQYFTGSQEHNVKMRELALKKGQSLNEYSLIRQNDGEKLFFSEEKKLYEHLGLQYIPPELRQNGSEILQASRGELPVLVEMDHIRGDLHCHTCWSDGQDTLQSMAEAATKKGLEYLLITDHSFGLGVAKGLSGPELKGQATRIEELNEKYEGKFRLLKGIEVEVKADGSLDLGEEILSELDMVVAAVHSSLGQGREKITERFLKAVENPLVHVIAHPTGRLLNSREEADVDWDALFTAAAETGTLLEINANPRRLDLPDRLIRRARKLGCRFVISTDAHSREELDYMRFGVGMARRGGLSSKEIANSESVESLMSILKK